MAQYISLDTMALASLAEFVHDRRATNPCVIRTHQPNKSGDTWIVVGYKKFNEVRLYNMTLDYYREHFSEFGSTPARNANPD